MDRYVFGTLLFVNDKELTYFVTEPDRSKLKRWMFQYGWKVFEEISWKRKGMEGYKIILRK